MASGRGLWVLVGLLCTGCPDEGDGERAGDAAHADAGRSDGGGLDAARPDAAAPADAGPDARPPDAGPPPDMAVGTPVTSCQEACDRYAGCERLGELFGDEGACLVRCERVERAGQTAAWWDCLEDEVCDLLHRCPVPAPPPLPCGALCEVVDACGVAVPDCDAACAAADEPFRRCGEALVGTCDGDAFAACLGQDVYPACAAFCADAVRCNLARADACLLDCVADAADPDPLFALRTRERDACLAAAPDDCAAVDRCLHPPGPDDQPVADPALFCQLYRACGFDAFMPCELALDQFDPDGNLVPCGVALLRQGCPPSPIEILQACQDGGPVGGDRAALCGRLCDAQAVCDAADPAARLACTRACVEGETPALACLVEDHCPAFLACTGAVGPGVECAAYCAALAPCGLADADCQATCEAGWRRDRGAQARACVAAAEGCGAIAACAPSPGPPCAAYCERAEACGLEAPDGRCEDRCDDAHFADPAPALLFDACVISAPACGPGDPVRHTVSDCPLRPEDGLACLGFCRAQVECAGGDPAALGDCLTACRRGFEGDDGVGFRLGRACLAAQPADAACPALAACLPAADPDCALVCGAADACGVALADCPAACAGDALARLHALERAPCVRAAAGDCAAVSQCLQPTVPLPPEGQADLPLAVFCTAYNACGFDQRFGPCEQVVGLVGGGGPQLRCVYDILLAGCPADPLAAVGPCLGQEAGPSPLAGPCATLCDRRALCDAALDPVACQDACEGQLDDDAQTPRRLGPQLACGDAWACADLDACLASSSPADVCAAHCARLAACDAGPADCAATCLAGFADETHYAWRDCVGRAPACDGVGACAAP